ncbi:aldehyde dehydrogenase family protein [Motiliproteus sp.]|uniref:aldehyde dehydrogenase family protein n=1 Tax=Motiliproteus sp. TaxID=1898955 RepID=UPI003BABE2A8
MSYIQSTISPSPKAAAFLDRQHRMLIGSRWCDALSGETLEVENPATGELIARIPRGEAADVELAVKAARDAFESSDWSRMRPPQREKLMWRLAELMEQNIEELAELESIDNGKSAVVAQHVDITVAIDFLRYMAGWSTKIEGRSVDASVTYMPDANLHGYTRREAVGVVGAVIAWNFPLLLAIWKLAPALATGCTMVIKPAQETSLSVLRLAELVLEAGFPPGVFNVVTGEGHVAGDALVKHPGVDKLTFTGSTEVGKLIGKAAMDNMTRVTLELGGKSPVIVLPDADIAQAAAGAATGIFFNSGQVCCAGSRLYVHKKVFDNTVAEIANIAQGMSLGQGLDPNVDLGPLVSRKQLDRVCGYIEDGRSQGASIVTGGGQAGDKGYFVEPTILVDVDQSARVVQEEIFGPVMTAIPFDDIDEVVRMANDSPYGLGASIWSNNLSQVHRMIPQIKSGSVWVNCHTALSATLPFGGYKQSGVGREMGAEAIEHYTEVKTVLMSV